jgi:hypothetical protein
MDGSRQNQAIDVLKLSGEPMIARPCETWILTAGRLGDLKQMRALAAALKLVPIEKTLVFQSKLLSSGAAVTVCFLA